MSSALLSSLGFLCDVFPSSKSFFDFQLLLVQILMSPNVDFPVERGGSENRIVGVPGNISDDFI